jgi:hypothetical protein
MKLVKDTTYRIVGYMKRADGTLGCTYDLRTLGWVYGFVDVAGKFVSRDKSFSYRGQPVVWEPDCQEGILLCDINNVFNRRLLRPSSRMTAPKWARALDILKAVLKNEGMRGARKMKAEGMDELQNERTRH